MPNRAEVWKAVLGWEGSYEVSDHGRVRSVDRPRIYKDGRRGRSKGQLLRGSPLKSGHLQVCLRRSGCQGRHLVHHLVLAAFVGKCPSGQEACHDDGNGSNNRRTNLRWDTHAANEADKTRHGTSNQGGHRSGAAKLTPTQVHRIRLDCTRGIAQKILARKYGVDPSAISHIVHRRSWKHLAHEDKGN